MSFQFQTFSLLLYLLESSVIGDLRRYYCRCFGGRDVPTESIWYSELSKCVCFDCSTNLPFPISISLLGPPYFLKHSNIEIKPINNPKMTSKYSSERKSQWMRQLSLLSYFKKLPPGTPTFSSHHPDQSASVTIEARPSMSKKIMIQWRLRCSLLFSSNRVFFN